MCFPCLGRGNCASGKRLIDLVGSRVVTGFCLLHCFLIYAPRVVFKLVPLLFLRVTLPLGTRHAPTCPNLCTPPRFLIDENVYVRVFHLINLTLIYAMHVLLHVSLRVTLRWVILQLAPNLCTPLFFSF